MNEIGHIAESEIYRYIREIETNESQYLGGLLREIYEKSLQGKRFSHPGAINNRRYKPAFSGHSWRFEYES